MSEVIDRLEDRVNAVGDLVRHLRREVSRLEEALAESHAAGPPSPPDSAAPAAAPDEGLLEEISRLRDERAMLRERVRGLIREIDQVAW